MNRSLSRFSGLIYATTICVMLLSALVLYRNVRARTAALERVSHPHKEDIYSPATRNI